jgi:O-antigen/teichoic acid export membrane protein
MMLAQKLIVSYSTKILIQFVQIVVSIVVARVAGPTVLGTVAFGIAFVSMFEFLASLGIGPAHIKLVSEGQDLGTCISTFSILKIINTFLFFGIVLGIFLVQKYALHVQFESRVHEYVILISLITVTINQLFYIPYMTFAGKTEQAKQDIPEFLRIFIYQILRVIIVLLGYRAVALALGNLVATILIAPLVFYLFKDYPRASFDKKLALRYLKISLPMIVIGMTTKITTFLDKVMLQYLANSEQVGYYTAGYRIGSLVLMIANSVGMLFFPLFSKATAAGDFDYIKRTIEKFERFSFIFIMPGVIFLSIYSDVIIKVLLGSQYLPSISIMAIINIAMFLMVLNMPYGNVITGMGFFKLFSVLSIVYLLLFITLMYVLPNPNFFNLGSTGAATAILISSIFIGLLYRLYAKQKCPILELMKNAHYILFGIVNFICFSFVYTFAGKFYGMTFKLLFIPGYFGITYLILFSLGWLNKEDIGNFKKLLNLRKVGSYIKNEMSGK